MIDVRLASVQTERLSRRNRRTAVWLVAWIALLMAVSIVIIWVRN